MIQSRARHTHFDFALQHVLNDFFGIRNLEGNGEAGMILLKITQQFRQKIFSRDGARAQREFSLDPLGEFAHCVQGLFAVRQNPGGMLIKNLSSSG